MSLFDSLNEAEQETVVTLFHGGFGDGDGGAWDKTHAYFSRAWPNVMKNLKKSFEEKLRKAA